MKLFMFKSNSLFKEVFSVLRCRTNIIKKSIWLFLIAIIFNSCEKDELKHLSDTKNSIANSQLENNNISSKLDSAAKQLALCMGNQQIRQLIKSEAAKKFDGDFEVLWSNFRKTIDRNMSENKNLPVMQAAEINCLQNIANMAAEIPQLQIAVPVQCEEWNVDSHIPLVAFDPLTGDENEVKMIKAYDAEGNAHYIDAWRLPDVPIVVVGINERTDENGKLIYFENATGFKNDETLNTKGYQDDNLYLKKMKVYNIKEPWYKGDAEIRMMYIERDSPNTNYVEHITGIDYSKDLDRDKEGEWVDVNKKLSSDMNDNDFFILFWYEDDTGSIVYEEAVWHNSVCYLFKMQLEDDELGYNIITVITLNSTSSGSPLYFYTDGFTGEFDMGSPLLYSLYTE
jgi:hypothetical protein